MKTLIKHVDEFWNFQFSKNKLFFGLMESSTFSIEKYSNKCICEKQQSFCDCEAKFLVLGRFLHLALLGSICSFVFITYYQTCLEAYWGHKNGRKHMT